MSTELIKVEEFTSLMKSAPDALGKNQKSIANCKFSRTGNIRYDSRRRHD